LASAADRIERTLFLAADAKLEIEYQDMPGTNSRLVPPPALRVRTIPCGVLSPQERRVHPDAPGIAQPAAVMLVGSGFDVAGWTAALKGCHEAIRSGLDLLLFADVLAAKRSNLWAVARSLGLLERLSLIDNLESRRDLVLHGDLLLLPEARGEQRSIILQAMAAEMLVIAATDPSSSILQADRTCVTINPGNFEQWAVELRRLLTDRTAALTLAESAKFFIQMHRRASDHVRGVIKAYTDLTAGQTLKFPR
jgi:glycosyltransferase involved in cell wall biosynthesis